MGGWIIMEQLNGITEMINSYTDQLERYESLSTWYAAFSAVCIMVVFGCAIGLILYQKGKEEQQKGLYHIILSGLFMFIPTIVTLYLYVFAMNMRKVALYRGYLSFLEEQWNSLAGLEIMQFDNKIIPEFLSIQNFPVNGLGPAVMGIFILLAFGIGFGLSAFYLKKLQPSKTKNLLTCLFCILMVICISFSGLCTYHLSINDAVVEAVIHFCGNKT